MGIYEYVIMGSYVFMGAFSFAKLVQMVATSYKTLLDISNSIPLLWKHPLFEMLARKCGWAYVPPSNYAISLLTYYTGEVKNGVYRFKTPYGDCFVIRTTTLHSDEHKGSSVCVNTAIFVRQSTFDDAYFWVFLSFLSDHLVNVLNKTRRSVHHLVYDENGSSIGSMVSTNFDTPCSKQMGEIRSRCVSFMNRKPLYEKRGLMWKTCFALCGPPGSGKTKFIITLATTIDASIVFLKPTLKSLDAYNNAKSKSASGMIGSILLKNPLTQEIVDRLKSDPEYMREYVKTLSTTPACTIYVFDDIDHDLRASETLSAGASPQKLLMEFLDGPRSRPGITILTMNDRTVLEEYSDALMRPGRCDQIYEMGAMDAQMAGQMVDYLLDHKEIDSETRAYLKESFEGRMVAQVMADMGLADTVDEIVSIVKSWDA